MFPLASLLTVAVFYNDRKVGRYTWPLIIFGLSTALYHNLLYYHWISEALSPCARGISCTSRQVQWFGFLTVPLLSLMGFASIACSQLIGSLSEKVQK
jgi:disulfide bond formation protein DsbB